MEERVWVSVNGYSVFICKKQKDSDKPSLFVVAGAGLERCDLRVMSPTSYQLLHPASR